MSKPIELAPLDDKDIPAVLTARLDLYKKKPDPYVPVDEHGFAFAYRAFGRNLRSALGACLDYSEWIVENEKFPVESDAKLALLVEWLSEEGNRHLQSVSGVGAAGWKVFDLLAATGGIMSPGDFNRFGYPSYQALNAQSKKLKTAHLLRKIAPGVDEDQRTKTYAISAEGWKVAVARGWKPMDEPPDTGTASA